MVSGQLSPEENCPQVRVGVWVKVRVSFRAGGQPDNCPRGKLSSGQGQGLPQGQFCCWGTIFLGGNCPRTQKNIQSKKRTLIKKSAERKWRNFHFISIVKLQNLISRISVPPMRSSRSQMFFKTGAFNITPYSQENTCVEVSF